MNMRQSDKTFINSQIRAPFVLCIDHENLNLGVISTSQALSAARQAGLDLVQVNPPSKDRPPTCKIMDYGKHKYDLSKKKKESAKKQRETLVKDKEIWLTPNTSLNDIKTKARKAQEILSEGHRLRVKIKFSGRELDHKEVAIKTLDDFIGCIPDAKFENAPKFEGKVLIISVVLK